MSDERISWTEDKVAVAATYGILSDPHLMREFDPQATPLEEAADLKMSSLDYWLHTTGNADALQTAASEAAEEFWFHVVTRHPGVEKRDPSQSSAKLLRKIKAKFASGNATLRDLADTLDDCLKFPND